MLLRICRYPGDSTEGRSEARQILRAQGTVKAEDLSAALSIVWNVSSIDLQRHKVQPAATRLIPVEFARKHTLVPLDVVATPCVVYGSSPGQPDY